MNRVVFACREGVHRSFMAAVQTKIAAENLRANKGYFPFAIEYASIYPYEAPNRDSTNDVESALHRLGFGTQIYVGTKSLTQMSIDFRDTVICFTRSQKEMIDGFGLPVEAQIISEFASGEYKPIESHYTKFADGLDELLFIKIIPGRFPWPIRKALYSIIRRADMEDEEARIQALQETGVNISKYIDGVVQRLAQGV